MDKITVKDIQKLVDAIRKMKIKPIIVEKDKNGKYILVKPMPCRVYTNPENN